MKPSVRRLLLTAAAIAAASAATGLAPARAQIVYGVPAGADLGFVLTSWKLDRDGREVTVDQMVSPVTGFVPLREDTEARYFLAYGSSEAKLDDGSHKLTGLSDVRLQLSRSLSQDRVILGLGLNLPTGKKKLDLGDEWLVEHYLSQDFLMFPLRRLGEGLGISASVGGASRWGSVLLGGTLSYEYSGSYESYAGLGDYDPGDQVALTLRAETTSERLKVFAGLTYADFTVDKLDGVKVYDQSWYVRSSLGLERTSRSAVVSTRASYILRDRSTTYDETGASLNHLRIYGDEFAWRAALSLRGGEGRDWHAGPLVELRWIEANEFDRGEALVQAYGLAGGVPLSSRLTLGADVRYWTGRADGDAVDLSGYQASLTLSGVLQ